MKVFDDLQIGDKIFIIYDDKSIEIAEIIDKKEFKGPNFKLMPIIGSDDTFRITVESAMKSIVYSYIKEANVYANEEDFLNELKYYENHDFICRKT